MQDSRASSLLNLLNPSSNSSLPLPSDHPSGQGQSVPTTQSNVDSLFRNLSPPTNPFTSRNTSPPAPSQPPSQPQNQASPTTTFHQQPLSPSPSSTDPSSNDPTSSTNTDRQTAHLSLLGSLGSPENQQHGPNNEMKGKRILDQLVESQSENPFEPRAPSPPGSSHHSHSPTLPPLPPIPPQPQPSQSQGDTRKSLFDFVSPFDALNSVKKKPVPPVNPPPLPQQHQPQPQSTSSSTNTSPLLSHAQVHNVVGGHYRKGSSSPEPHFQRDRYSSPSNPRTPDALQSQSQPPPPPQSQSQQAGIQAQDGGRPLPVPPPTSQPPLPSQIQQQQPPPPPPQQQRISPVSYANPAPPLPPQSLARDTQRERERERERERREREREETSPIPFPSINQPPQVQRVVVPPPQTQSQAKPKENVVQGGGAGLARQASHRVPVPSQPSLAPTYTLDVLSPLSSLLAPPGLSQVTPIALLKLENLYLPGTTIGVSGFIAYAMTRGRVRLIARSNGARALLKLPPSFPPTSSVTDMVVSGNRLACVTSDGGFVVYEVPQLVDDDTPSRTLLHIHPTEGPLGLKLVKWHPHQPGTLAVGSEREIYLLNVQEAWEVFKGEGVGLSELGKVGKVFGIPSPLVSFTFDVPQVALASISIDSTLTLWSIKEKLPFWTGRVPGDGLPSSIDFLEGGIIIGRKQGTVLQLLPVMSTNVCGTVKFTVGSSSSSSVGGGEGGEDDAFFAHVAYDPKIRTLWVAHSARSSLFALRVSFQDSRPSFEQIVEFPTPMQCINMALLTNSTSSSTADDSSSANPNSNSNIADMGGLAVAAFAMHAGGVDQVNIGREVFESAILRTLERLPVPTFESVVPGSSVGDGGVGVHTGSSGGEGSGAERRRREREFVPPMATAMGLAGIHAPAPGTTTPPSEPEGVDSVPLKGSKPKAKAAKGEEKKEEKKEGGGGGKGKSVEKVDEFVREIRKVEENLQSRIGKLITKELDKQHQRLEDLRHADQAADFTRQETILKLISTELTKNTTRVVELAVRSEVQNSVLPALENITKMEVRAALNGQIAKGLGDSMKQGHTKTLPNEIERLLLRPDVSTHVARTFSSAVTPQVEKIVKDSINKVLIPAYTQATHSMHLDMSRELRAEILDLKKEVITWQSEALKGTESIIRDMEHSIRTLSEQVKVLSMQVSAFAQHQARASPAPPSHSQQSLQHNLQSTAHLRQGSIQPSQPLPQQMQSGSGQGVSQTGPSSYPPQSSWLPQGPPPQMQQQQQQQQQPQQQQQQQQPQQPPPPPQQQQQQQQPPPPPQIPTRVEDWDETFLSTLSTMDPRQLRELLSRCNPEVIMPSGGNPSPLSQAVVLTLIHRLSSSLAELSPVDESFKAGLWWLQRAAYTLTPKDAVIAPYVGRVLQTAQTILQTTSSRINLLPGGPSLTETNLMIAQIQLTLGSKQNDSR